MSNATITDKETWLQARTMLLEKEKAHVQAGDELAAQRRALPKYKLSKHYQFEGPDGPVSLAQLFGKHSQLIVQHFMFQADWDAGCPSCSFWADGYNPMVIHLQQRDVSFVAVSRAPLSSLKRYKQRMSWTFPWVSSLHNEFNFDFAVTPRPEQVKAGTMQYNYRNMKLGGDEYPGISVFSRAGDGSIYHHYSTYGRGLDRMNAAYAYLDLTPMGRNEDDLPWTMVWLKRHDEYLA